MEHPGQSDRKLEIPNGFLISHTPGSTETDPLPKLTELGCPTEPDKFKKSEGFQEPNTEPGRNSGPPKVLES